MTIIRKTINKIITKKVIIAIIIRIAEEIKDTIIIKVEIITTEIMGILRIEEATEDEQTIKKKLLKISFVLDRQFIYGINC